MRLTASYASGKCVTQMSLPTNVATGTEIEHFQSILIK
jgi:hypothetical protein